MGHVCRVVKHEAKFWPTQPVKKKKKLVFLATKLKDLVIQRKTNFLVVSCSVNHDKIETIEAKLRQNQALLRILEKFPLTRF